MSNKTFFERLDYHRERDQKTLKKFLQRFDYFPSCKNKMVLDFGCGSGLLTQVLAQRGAKEVLGLDIDNNILDYAKKNLPESIDRSKVKFISAKLNSISDNSFDLIFSKDTLEHCQNPEETIKQLERVLAPGGELVVGFGPFWHGPFGDHQILKTALGFSLPWLHLLLPHEVIINLFNNSSLKSKTKVHLKKMSDIQGYLNQYTIKDFREFFFNSSLEPVFYEENRHEKVFLNFLGKANKFTFLEKFFGRNIYGIFRKV